MKLTSERINEVIDAHRWDTAVGRMELCRAIEAELEKQASKLPPEIALIIRNLHTQDNRITESPLFAVQQKRRIYGVDDGYCDNAEWVVDGETWTPEDDEDGDEPPSGARKVGYIDEWEFVTGCLTEQGGKDFIRVNGHNLHEPRIYAYGSFRNAEFIALRKWLMSLLPSPSGTTEGGAS